MTGTAAPKPLGAILAEAERDGQGLTAMLPEAWLQGRTAYGGVSAAIALEGARCAAGDLPPLRSAQISFVGPLPAGPVRAEAKLLRRGRSSAFVAVDLVSAGALALAAIFVFMKGRDSALTLDGGRAPAVPSPEDAVVSPRKTAAPAFVHGFEFRHAHPIEMRGEPDICQWGRLRDRDGLDTMTEIVAIADALPPAALGTGRIDGPVSSVTWLVNLLTDRPQTEDGWWLLRAKADHAARGCSSQAMHVWNAAGEPIAAGMQSVALFG